MAVITWGVCLALAAWPDIPPRFIATDHFTLAWTHSIEKTRWEEDYQILPPAVAGDPPQLVAKQARVRGSAAGMEPPADAVLKNGWYIYQPPQPLEPVLRLMRSTYVGDYDWCVHGQCLPMRSVMPTDGDVTLLSACAQPPVASANQRKMPPH